MKCKKHKWCFVEKRTYTNPGEPQETYYEFVCSECGEVKNLKEK